MGVKAKLKERGAANLREFGYPHATAENIMDDLVYRGFFKSMLEDNLGNGFDDEIGALIREIDERSEIQPPTTSL